MRKAAENPCKQRAIRDPPRTATGPVPDRFPSNPPATPAAPATTKLEGRPWLGSPPSLGKRSKLWSNPYSENQNERAGNPQQHIEISLFGWPGKLRLRWRRLCVRWAALNRNLNRFAAPDPYAALIRQPGQRPGCRISAAYFRDTILTQAMADPISESCLALQLLVHRIAARNKRLQRHECSYRSIFLQTDRRPLGPPQSAPAQEQTAQNGQGNHTGLGNGLGGELDEIQQTASLE
jgi:hypothetical protein